MTFLSLSIENSCMTQQKAVLDFQDSCLGIEENQITEEMGDYTAKGGKTSDSTYCSLEAYQEVYSNQKASIESQLEAINAQLETYQKSIETNVKSECKLSVSV